MSIVKLVTFLKAKSGLDWKKIGADFWTKFKDSMNQIIPTATVTDQWTVLENVMTRSLGAVLMEDGKIFNVPAGGNASVYDPATGNITMVTMDHTGDDGFMGGVLMHDGRVYMFPRDSTSARIYDPQSNSISTPNGTYTNTYGGVVLPDGRVFSVPANGGQGNIYDPKTNTLTQTSGSTPTGWINYTGATLLADGRVFISPALAENAQIYDPVTDTFSTPSGTYGGFFGFAGAVLLPNGKVFISPCSSATGRIYDPVTDTLTVTAGTIPNSSVYAYFGAALLPNGKVFICPVAGPTNAAIYDPATDSFSSTSNYSFSFYENLSCVAMLDGRIYMPQLNGQKTVIYGNASASFDSNVVLSGYYNKL